MRKKTKARQNGPMDKKEPHTLYFLWQLFHSRESQRRSKRSLSHHRETPRTCAQVVLPKAANKAKERYDTSVLPQLEVIWYHLPAKAGKLWQEDNLYSKQQGEVHCFHSWRYPANSQTAISSLIQALKASPKRNLNISRKLQRQNGLILKKSIRAKVQFITACIPIHRKFFPKLYLIAIFLPQLFPNQILENQYSLPSIISP